MPTNASSLDELDAQDWSIPPKAVLRNQGPPLSDAAWSFLYDASTPLPEPFPGTGFPLAASTPARRPLANKTPDRNRIRRDDTTAALYNAPSTRPITPESPIRQESLYATGAPMEDIDMDISEAHEDPRRALQSSHRPRRRTMVHVSSDSIFSSPLDFTAQVSRGSMLHTDRSRSLPGSAGRSMDDLASMDLTSLIGTTHTHTRRASESSMDLTVTLNTLPGVPCLPDSSISLLSAFATPANSPFALNVTAAAASNSTSQAGDYLPPPSTNNNTDLGDLLSGLDLEEPKDSTSRTTDVKDAVTDLVSEGVHASTPAAEGTGKRRTRAGTIRPSDFAWNTGKDKTWNQGRNRAGTIRASDFGQGKPVPQLAAAPPGRPRARSRSGTISAPNRPPSGPLPPIPSSSRPQTKSGVSGSSLPVPTMKVKHYAKPLSPQKSGESDDELLLIPRALGGPFHDTEG
ncbi:hypothetical protein GLOTRDRAFT_128672 [Gloeophyllum trabeum ATCC 11539]|uniref:Uncharacterized protein n=1 Tax=Gloeophyllum trabeum (strain ATCC 11539 / FP-39264 / Madison 617) TaxID=670483 RepID=S7QA08_GLOTA|nr:uncharacterized protein GLOTRDRAFT_128672 [Gloeophyllum trabeum ATCC 11539]EPQ56736.1 hypothetical protein GLOTRDRAFT_128672 [Gloeophyllum trabeum ATCC 11539]